MEEYRRDAAAAIDRIKRGEDPKPPEPAPEPTVADLATLCLKDHVAARCKPATAENYRKSIECHILLALGSRALKDVMPEDTAKLHHALRGTPAAANQAIWVLSKMFSLAENWEMVPPGRNPCRHVRHYRATPRERFLTPDEFRRIGDALKAFEAKGKIQPSAIAAIRLLMLTGCRKGEVLALRWPDVDLDAGELRLPDAKSGPRAVQLPPPAVRLLDTLPRRAGSPWVFPGRDRDGRYSAGGLDHAWYAVREAAKLEDARIHDLRHSFASRALALGETLPVIGKLLGHNDIETTARYAHLAQDSVHEAAERIARSIAADVL